MAFRGRVTVEFNGLKVPVEFDVHAEASMDKKEDLVRMAAQQCVSDFFETYRCRGAATPDGDAIAVAD